MKKRHVPKVVAAVLCTLSFHPLHGMAQNTTEIPAGVEAPTALEDGDDLLPKEGVSLHELKQNIVKDLKFRLEGDGEKTLKITGELPARCAKDAAWSSEFSQGKHKITVRLASACEKDFKAKSGEKRVSISSVLKPIALDDKSGPIVIRYFKSGDAGDESREQSKEHILGMNGEKMAVKNSFDRKNEDIAMREAEELAETQKHRGEVLKQAMAYCQNKDLIGVSKLLQEYDGLIENAQEIVANLNQSYHDSLVAEMKAAKDGESARKAFEAFRGAARKHRWDHDELNSEYIALRLRLIDEAGKGIGSDEEARAFSKDADDFRRELSVMDPKVYRQKKAEFGKAYGDVAAYYMKKKNLELAVTYYEKAKEFVSDADKTRVDRAIANVYGKEYEKCLANKKSLNPERCDKLWKEKARQYDESAGERMAEAAADGGENAIDEYAEFLNTYVYKYGKGPQAYYYGYGYSNPYSPGWFEMMKYNAIQNVYHQQAQQQRMYGGGGMMGGGFGRGPF